MNSIRNKNIYSEEKLKEIEYGLVSIYLTMTKVIFILFISIILNFFKEVIVFMILFNIIRTVAFGLHATKSWICWITSTITFLFIPYISKILELNIYIVQILCLINVLFILKNSPADTKKRPIVNKKRRKIYNILSTLISIIYSIISITTENHFIQNCLMFSLIVENILIAPTTYKLFGLPYDNYIKYLKEHPDFTY